MDLSMTIICDTKELSIYSIVGKFKPRKKVFYKNEPSFWAAVEAEKSKWGPDRVRIST